MSSDTAGSDIPKTDTNRIAAKGNRCPRCSGTMLHENDFYGSYETCMTCGYVYEPSALANVERLTVEEKEKPDPRQRQRRPSHGKTRL